MTPAVAAAQRAGVVIKLHEYEVGAAEGPTYGEAAAAALGVPAARVFKTLVTKLDGRRLCAAVVPVTGQLDLKALAQAAGAKRAAMADTAEAETATGYVLGGISPLGHRRPLKVFVDLSVQDHTSILFSGGRRGLQIEMAPADLLKATGATVAAIARNPAG